MNEYRSLSVQSFTHTNIFFKKYRACKLEKIYKEIFLLLILSDKSQDSFPN